MKEKREAGAPENKKCMPTPLAPSETINIDSPSPNKNQSSPKPTASKPVSPLRTYSPYGDTDLEKKRWGRTLRMPPVSTVKPSDPNYNSPTFLFSSSFTVPPSKFQPNPFSSKQSDSSVLQNLETHLG